MPDEVFDILGRVAVDTSAFREIPQRAKQTNSELARTPATVRMELDTTRAMGRAAAMRAALTGLDDVPITPKLNTKPAEAQIASLRAQMASSLSQFNTAKTGGMEGILTGKAMGLAGVAGAVGGVAMYAAPMVTGAVAGTIGKAAQQERYEDFMGRAYGTNAQQFVASARALSDQTGFLASDFMQASLIGKTLVANYGLQEKQIEELIKVSADLAATSPYEDIRNVSNAMERLQSAVRGEAEASERLGLTLNDTYMKNIAFDGSLKDTWEKLSDLEKAQYRYKEVLSQTKDVMGAAEDDEGLSANIRMLSGQMAELGAAVGETAIPALITLIAGIRSIGDAIPDWLPRLVGGVAGVAGKVGGFIGLGVEDFLPYPYNIAANVAKAHEDGADVTRRSGGGSIPVGSPVAAATGGGGALTINNKITIDNQGSTPVQVKDAQSYSPSNY